MKYISYRTLCKMSVQIKRCLKWLRLILCHHHWFWSQIIRHNAVLLDHSQQLDPYERPDGEFDEALTGSVHCQAYNEFIAIITTELFAPNMQWIDPTFVIGNDRFLLKSYRLTHVTWTESSCQAIKARGYTAFYPREGHYLQKKQTQKFGTNIISRTPVTWVAVDSDRQKTNRLCDKSALWNLRHHTAVDVCLWMTQSIP